MNLGLASLIVIGSLLVLLALGLEIAPAMGLVAAIGLFFFVNKPVDQFAYSAYEIMNSFTLTAIPLFVLMGAIFESTGVMAILFNAADKIVSGLPGGVAAAVIAANAIFGAMSGSSVAAVATFGKICFPAMRRLGYAPSLTLGSIAVAGTLSVLIPPSIILIVYGGWLNVSVARLFAAGLIPGIILTVLLILTVIFMVILNPRLVPKSSVSTGKEKLRALVDTLPFLVIVGLVLGMLFGGVMTPTEAGAVGAFLSIVFATIYRRMTLKALTSSLWTAVTITAMVAFLMFTARVLGQVFQYVGLADAFSTLMAALPLGRYGVYTLVCILYLILGCFFDSLSMLVLTLPFVAPVMESLGFNLIWFGVVYVVLAEIGMVTPPFGLNLFVLHGVVPEHDIMEIVRGSLPFLIPLLFLILLLTVLPQLALWLPGVLY